MINVVLDTNVLVSALLTPKGNCAVILNDIFVNKYRICFDSEIFTEYMEVLSREKFGFDESDVYNFLKYLKYKGLWMISTGSTETCVDKDDQKFYNMAVTVNGYIVTGNVKHFPEKDFILSPIDFLEKLKLI